MYRKTEEERFRAGAEYFKQDYDKLKNKRQYKACEYLHTAIQYFTQKEKIEVFTSCIADTEYLYSIFDNATKDATVYYYNSKISIDELNNHYVGKNVKFMKISKNPLDEFKHNTIVFASNDTVVFDPLELGIRYLDKNQRNVYRDKSKEHFSKYHYRAIKLI